MEKMTKKRVNRIKSKHLINVEDVFVEMERKYYAKNINKNDFLLKLEGLNPFKKVVTEGTDYYYEGVDSVVRYRNSEDCKELTIKNRLSSKTILSRKEVDLDVFNNLELNVFTFLKALGYKESFKIYKKCDIYWFRDEGVELNVVFYTVFSDFKDPIDFIEIEVKKGTNYKTGKAIINKWEKKLGLKIGWRVCKSLYEIYSGKLTPFVNKSDFFCGSCGTVKTEDSFYLRESGKPKQGDTCIECAQKYWKSEEGKAKKKIKRSRYASKIAAYNKKYRAENKEKIVKRRRVYLKEKYQKDPIFKIKTALRSRNLLFLKSKKIKKTNKTFDILGCSAEFFKSYIESMFYDHPVTGEKMTWENRGRGPDKWQIDHIVPFVDIDVTNEEDVKKVCNYKNMRPLWGDEHLKKSIEERKKGFKILKGAENG
jgi:adenylate cyclase class IV